MKAYQKQPARDVYQIITDLIVEKLESGFIPWHRPWSAYGPAVSYVSRKPYRGINALLMNFLPFEKPFYLTFRQVQELGGHIRKGCKSVPVIYWNYQFFEAKTGEKLSEQQARALPAKQVRKSVFLKYYNVFNIDQVEGVDFKIPALAIKPENQVLQSCEDIVSNMPQCPRIQHENPKRAFYSPLEDYVNIPSLEFFQSSEFFYSVLFHELTHATGHTSRLNRPEISEPIKMHSESYSKEELVAELGASFLCGQAGIQCERTVENSAAYIQGWLGRLGEDKQLIVEAAAKAQKAADFILGVDQPI